MNEHYGTIRPKYRNLPDGGKYLMGYEGRMSIGKNINGRQNQKSFYGCSIESVKRKMDEFRGTSMSPADKMSYHIKVKEWTDYWFHHYKEYSLRESSKKSVLYQLKLINNVAGEIFLESLVEYNLQTVINMRIASGVASGTVKLLDIVIKECFLCAYRYGFLKKDIFSHLKTPKIQQKERIPLSSYQDALLKDAITGGPYENYIIFLRGSAARKMEGLGVSWNDIDEENHIIYLGGQLRKEYVNGRKKLSVEKTTKNGVFAPIFAPQYVFDALQKERQHQKQLAANNPGYRNKDNLVFTDDDGNPLDPDNIDKYVKTLKEAIGRKDFGLHVLRHTRATEVYYLTKDPLIVQSLLRHRYLSSTYHYLHMIPGSSMDLMEVKGNYIDDVFRPLINEKNNEIESIMDTL